MPEQRGTRTHRESAENEGMRYAYACFTLLLAAGWFGMAGEMSLVKLHVDTFVVVGIETRTSNAREMTGEGNIGKLWGRMRDEHLLAKIPNRLDSRVVIVYTNYESDENGPYTYVLGAKVSSAKDVPPGMVAQTVRSGNYAMFTGQGVAASQLVVDLWKRIWSLEKPGALARAYRTDFEVHYQGLSEDPAAAHVDVYVGLEDRH